MDVWALGVTFYELCTGNFVSSALELLMLETLPDYEQILKNYSEAFELIKKMLTVNPNERPSSYDLIVDKYIQ